MLDNGNGLLFSPAEPWRKERKRKTHNLNLDYNRLYEDQTEAREAILREILGELQEGVFLQGPITFHYGIHTKIGRGTFINFNFTCQDDTAVTIGEHCNFGPNVTIVTPLHPMLAAERRAIRVPDGRDLRLCWAKPVSPVQRWIRAKCVMPLDRTEKSSALSTKMELCVMPMAMKSGECAKQMA